MLIVFHLQLNNTGQFQLIIKVLQIPTAASGLPVYIDIHVSIIQPNKLWYRGYSDRMQNKSSCVQSQHMFFLLWY